MLQTTSKIAKKNIFFAIRTIIFTIIIFSAINILSTNNIKDIASSKTTTVPQQHKSADTYKTKFQTMCVNNILTCIRIDFEGDYTYKKKYFYLASIIYVSNFIDQNISTKLNRNMKNNSNFSRTIRGITLKANGAKRRGYATHNHIEINTDLIDSYTEFIEIFTHEASHIIDLGIIQGSNKQRSNIYTEFGKDRFATNDPSLAYYQISFKNETTRKAGSNKQEFCSRYGMIDPFEDFAECNNLYINHNNLFKYMANHNTQLQKKYDFIDNIFQHNYLKNDTKNNSKTLKKLIQNTERRTRDTTKL